MSAFKEIQQGLTEAINHQNSAISNTKVHTFDDIDV